MCTIIAIFSCWKKYYKLVNQIFNLTKNDIKSDLKKLLRTMLEIDDKQAQKIGKLGKNEYVFTHHCHDGDYMQTVAKQLVKFFLCVPLIQFSSFPN